MWLVLAWRGTGCPHRLGLLDEPLLGRARAPTARTLHRSLGYFSARAVRRAVEGAYLAELPRRAGRVWAALDAHQVRLYADSRRGHSPVPPAQLALATVLQAYVG